MLHSCFETRGDVYCTVSVTVVVCVKVPEVAVTVIVEVPAGVPAFCAWQPDANPARPIKSANSAAAANDCANRGRNLVRNPAKPRSVATSDRSREAS